MVVDACRLGVNQPTEWTQSADAGRSGDLPLHSQVLAEQADGVAALGDAGKVGEQPGDGLGHHDESDRSQCQCLLRLVRNLRLPIVRSGVQHINPAVTGTPGDGALAPCLPTSPSRGPWVQLRLVGQWVWGIRQSFPTPKLV